MLRCDMPSDLPAAMTALVAGVTRVRVIDSGVARGRALGTALLCELVGDDAAELLAHLAVLQPAGEFHCMCRGHPALELWAGDRLRATIGLHHGVSARVDGWWSDAPLRDGEGLLRTLAIHGVAAPLAELLAARVDGDDAARRRKAWLARAPAVLRARLAGLEGGAGLLPRHLRASDADAREAVDALRAALAADAAGALLGWYGGPGGPWSGYPAYESVAEVLLSCVPVEELIAAGDVDDPAVSLGLARYLARHGAPPRERGLVGEALRARLLARVDASGDDDMRARLAHALVSTARPANSGRRIGDAALATSLARPVACAGSWATLDGESLVRFDPGRTSGTTLATLPAGAAALAAVDGELVVTLGDPGEVWRVSILGGPPRVIARGQQHPTEAVGIGGRAAWLEQPRLPGHRTATRVRLEAVAAPLAEHRGNAWDLLACGGALWWARHGGSIVSSLFGKNVHRVDLLRWDPPSGRVEVVAELEGGDDGTSLPRLFSDGEWIAWTSGRRIGVMEPRTGARRWFEVDAEILAVHPRGDGVLVALARERRGELVHLHADEGPRLLAWWQRAPWERERIAVRGAEVVWNAGEHLWALELGGGPPRAEDP